MGVDDLLIAAAQNALEAMQGADFLLAGEGMQTHCEDEIKALKAALQPFLLTREKVLQSFMKDWNTLLVTGCETTALLQTALPQNDEAFKVGEKVGFELHRDVIVMVAPLHKGNLAFWLGVLNGVRMKML